MMSNLTGNYKISSGEVQGVDVLREREQERRARMQLLDDIREPSPQPIFGEPVKVDLEDETSRRIKNTLGDFTQVLTNDPKNLIGISRSTGSGHPNGHHSNGYTSAALPVNGYSMPPSHPSAGGGMAYMNPGYSSSSHGSSGHSSMNSAGAPFVKPNNVFIKKPHYAANGSSAIKQTFNYVSPKAPDKRVNYNNRSAAPKSVYGSGFNSEFNAAAPKLYPPPENLQGSKNPLSEKVRRVQAEQQHQHHHQQQKPPEPIREHSVSGYSSSSFINSKVDNCAVQNIVNIYANNISTTAPIWNCGPDTPAIQIPPFCLPSNATPSSTAKNMDYDQNTYIIPAKGESDKVTSTPPKRNQFRPSSIQIQPEKKEAPIAVETILKEMTKVVPPAPLTAIQTPRTEETGFAFPTEPKEDISDVFFKDLRNISLVEPFAEDMPVPTPVPETIKPSPKPYASSVQVSSLQDDLEMSDSDDEADSVVKETYQQSTCDEAITQSLNTNDTATTSEANTTASTNNQTKMDNNSAESSNSSSSESGDSDSDDSSSESNDSDSSSEASDEEVSSKKWGLSNFVDESQRIQSPRFFQGEAAKGKLRLQQDAKTPALGSVNSFNNTPIVKDTPSLPATEQTSSFLVPDVPVAAKSDILSPIPSPVHPAVGPRTPPSPNVLSQDCRESAESIQTAKSGKSDSPEAGDSLIPSSPLSDVLSFDEKTKKQLRSGAAKVELERVSSHLDLYNVENSAYKDCSEKSLTKEDSVSDVEKSTSSSVASNSTETPDNYSIKTRQRGSVLSGKKNKSSENSQKGDASPAIAKLKHPRACRKPNEKLSKKPEVSVTSVKPESVEQPKKRSKSESKEKPTPVPEKNDSVKSTNIQTVKPLKKNKTSKVPQKEITEVKKGEPKKKKFAIENFVQSPEVTGPSTEPKVFSPSPERSPLPDCAKSSPEADLPSPASAGIPSKTSSKVKSSDSKNAEKLRRSARCSERASHVPAETSTPISDSTKWTVEGVGENVVLLSPIPTDPSVSSETGESVIPFRIMVCIPFFKLSRLPAAVHQKQEAEKKGYRSRSTSLDEGKSQRDSSSDQTAKVASKRSSSKDFKDKSKVANPVKSSKNNTKNIPPPKKDKDLKTTTDASNKIKTDSSVNKTSAKIKSKSHADDADNTLPKKRKLDSNDQPVKKKKTLRVEEKKPKESPIGVRPELSNQNVNIEETNKLNSLERCDSTSSLSSLCSQQSQRSSKSSKDKKKDSSSSGPEVKRPKSSVPIKQEKEDRSKVHVKKEPRTSDKSKGKSREKITSKDIPEKCSEIWDDSCFSSQLQHIYDDQSSDDPKAKLSTNRNLGDDPDIPDWDSFAPDKLKEASLNKHNQAPIMPMDYYYTEGRKQKAIAEKEKDPFQQAVKFFEAAVLFILTSQQKEEYTKDPEAIYQFYERTLKYFGDIQTKVKNLQSCPGSTEFKLLILCLKCQSLLNVKLYNIKIKEIKEQTDGVIEFLHNYNSTYQSRHSSSSSIPSPQSSIPSPATSVNTQSSGYSSTISGSDMCLRSTIPGYLNVPQSMLDMICRQHTHLINLHRGHDNWEQADMYMTRSNLREFFKEVADQSEPLTLHSSITELVKYIQKGISLVKKSLR